MNEEIKKAYSFIRALLSPAQLGSPQRGFRGETMPHHHAEHRADPCTTISVHRESEGDPATLVIHGVLTPIAELDDDGLRAVAAMLIDATSRPDHSNGRSA